MVTRLLTLLTILASLTAFDSRARAQDYDGAGRHFAAGQERYAGKRFHTAALHFQAAYDITKDPVLLFNVGEAWHHAGNAGKAVAAYRAYLRERPAAQDRADVERRITIAETKKDKLVDESVSGDKAEADQIVAAGGRPPLPELASAGTTVAPQASPTSGQTSSPTYSPVASPAPQPGTPAPTTAPEPAPATAAPAPANPPPQPQVGILDDRPSSRLRIAAWCSVAATIAFLTTGAILGLAAQSRGDEIGRRLSFVDSSGQPREFDAGARTDYQTLRDEGKLYNGISIGFYSAAGAMAITSTVLFIVDWKKGRELNRPRAIQIAPTLAPGTAGLTIGGSF